VIPVATAWGAASAGRPLSDDLAGGSATLPGARRGSVDGCELRRGTRRRLTAGVL